MMRGAHYPGDDEWSWQMPCTTHWNEGGLFKDLQKIGLGQVMAE